MKNQTKWGIAFILLGLAILPVGFPFILVYSVPLVVIGMALIFYRRREERIEEARER